MASIMININSVKLRALLDDYNAEHGTTYAELSRRMGRTGAFLHTCILRGTVSPNTTAMLKALYGIRPEDYVGAEEEPKKKGGWEFKVDIEPEKGRCHAYIIQDGEVAVEGYAKIKDVTSKLSIVQATSYATHICYKKAEQEELEAL